MRDRLWRALRPGAWLVLVCLLGSALPLHADEGEDGEDEPKRPVDVAIAVSAVVDVEDAASTGQVLAHLTFTPLEDIQRPYSIRLRLMAFRRTVVNLDHAPKPPTVEWRKGQAVTYDMPIPLPLEIRPGADMGIFIVFHDPELDLDLPPRMDADRQGQVRELIEFPMPDLGPLEQAEKIDAVLTAAAQLAQKQQKPAAWNTLEVGLRRSVQDEAKYRFRDAMVQLGAFEPAPISVIEQEIVDGRIREEKTRYLRLISGRCFDRKQYHGALRILEAIGGKLSEDARGAVMGAVNDAKRTERDLTDLRVRILDTVSDEDRALVEKKTTSLGYTRKLLEAADTLRKSSRWGAARLILRGLTLNAPERDVAHEAGELQKQVEESWLQDTPPEEQQIVDAALNHPVWARTKAIATHKFIYIGPEALIAGVPEEARRRFDLAYVFLTDLFGRLPNPGGDRVTVYFKELWDFGGGVGGGKIIDIGKADKMKPGMRVDNGLLYHELTHCIDDTSPIFPGWREGLANFGAAYAYEALGQTSDSLHGFQKNLQQFKDDYLDRDLVYWRIPNYGPSAGFFLHFVEAHSKVGRKHDWKPYRQFFREYREAPIRDGRAPYIARAVAYYLIRAFGPKAFDDLLAFRFPLVAEDREAVHEELEMFAGGGHGADRLARKLEGHRGSPLPRDVVQGEMMQELRSGDREAARRISKERLGILHDWKVIGPFKEKGVNPGAFVFPPEKEIDYTKEYPGEANMCRWRDPQEQGVVRIDPTGYVHAEFNYMENTATYGLTYLTVPAAMDAVIHVRADDDVTLFLNDRLVENFTIKSEYGSTLLAWRGPGAPVPDQLRLPIHLEAGRNKLLVKVRNRQGTAGFILAVAQPDGHPIPGLLADTNAPPPEGTSRKPNPRRKLWTSVLKMNFKAKSFASKLKVEVGSFKVTNAALVGQDDKKQVGWRKYTVRPGFPKDAPSNLLWIKEKYTKDLDDFRLELDFAAPNGGAPKVAVQFQGEGGVDGLSGWNLILGAHGKDEISGQIERYEHMYYQVPRTKIPNAEVQKLVLTYKDRRLHVQIGDVVLFDDVSITPIKTGSRIGFSTWPGGLGLRALELSKPKKP
jgi:hypothetical protein